MFTTPHTAGSAKQHGQGKSIRVHLAHTARAHLSTHSWRSAKAWSAWQRAMPQRRSAQWRRTAWLSARRPRLRAVHSRLLAASLERHCASSACSRTHAVAPAGRRLNRQQFCFSCQRLTLLMGLDFVMLMTKCACGPAVSVYWIGVADDSIGTTWHLSTLHHRSSVYVGHMLVCLLTSSWVIMTLFCCRAASWLLAVELSCWKLSARAAVSLWCSCEWQNRMLPMSQCSLNWLAWWHVAIWTISKSRPCFPRVLAATHRWDRQSILALLSPAAHALEAPAALPCARQRASCRVTTSKTSYVEGRPNCSLCKSAARVVLQITHRNTA